MKLIDANIKIIQDSRGKDTLEAELKSEDFSAIASVPSGKSKGTHEAFVLEPKKAIEKFQEIKPQILGREFESQEDFDNFLIKLDGTPNKQNLGGNLTLSLSLAFARLKAKNENLELFQYIKQNSKLKTQNSKLPKPIFNVINGGAHATNPQSKLDFQEFQVIPEVEDFGIALSVAKEFYRRLGQFLENKFGKENITLGDEAGFSTPFKNNEEAIEILAELIAKNKYPLRIGLDIAATQMYQVSSKRYQVDGKEYSAEELKNLYLKLVDAYNILSVEDPFYEEAFDDSAKLNEALCYSIATRKEEEGGNRARKEKLVITDDLTTTSPERLKTAIEKKSGNAILIKPNQIGTLTETLKVVKMAYENNWQAVVSHRSGETMDDFIADLSVAVGAWGIKSGAPAAPERLAKYERILAINSKFQTNSKFKALNLK
jgi:enolase